MSDLLERMADDMIGLIEQLSTYTFEPDSPEDVFQKTMVAAANSYQRSKAANQ